MKRAGRSAEAAGSDPAQAGSTPAPAVPVADFRFGGGWGDHIALLHPEQFENTDLSRQVVEVYGHKTPHPKVGQTIVGEFQKSWIKFKFQSIEPAGPVGRPDPPDMFFGTVLAVEQVMKP